MFPSGLNLMSVTALSPTLVTMAGLLWQKTRSQTATCPSSRPESRTEGRAGDQRAEVIWRPPGEAAAMMQLPRTSSDHTFMLLSPVVAKILVNTGFLERNK